jgi:hypothetical protein
VYGDAAYGRELGEITVRREELGSDVAPWRLYVQPRLMGGGDFAGRIGDKRWYFGCLVEEMTVRREGLGDRGVRERGRRQNRG